MSVIPFLFVALGLPFFSESARSVLFRTLGISTSQQLVPTTSKLRLSGIVIAILLLVVLNPEGRMFLLFIDAVGFDIFLMLFVFQAREHMGIVINSLVMPLYRKISAWGPLPIGLPSEGQMAEFPYLSVCAIVWLTVNFVMVFGLSSAFLSQIKAFLLQA